MPALYTRYFPENARILHDNCPKNIFSNLRAGAPPTPLLLRFSFVGWFALTQMSAASDAVFLSHVTCMATCSAFIYKALL